MFIMITLLGFFSITISFGSSQQTVIFISPYSCNENSSCDGFTYYTALDSIMIALTRYNNTNQPLKLLLIPNSDNEHYLLGGEIRSNGSVYYNYTNDNIILDGSTNTQKGYSNKGLLINITNLTISPVFCSEFPNMNYPYCISDKSQMVKINIKTSFIIIQIEILNLQNVILDGNEDIYMLNAINVDSEQNILMDLKSNKYIDNCIYNRFKCCDNINKSSNDIISCIRLDIPYMKVLSFFDPNKGLFSFILSSGQNSKVSLNMINCKITNIWLPYRRSILYFISPFIVSINNTIFTNNLAQRSNIEFISNQGDITILQSSYSNYVTKFNNQSTTFSLGINTLITYENTNPGYTTNIQLTDMNLITSNLFSVFICLAYKDYLVVVNYTKVQMNNVQLMGMDNKLFGIRSMTQSDYDYSIYINDAFSFQVYNVTIYNVIKPIGLSDILQNQFIKCNFTQNYGKKGGVIYIISSKITKSIYIIDFKDSLFDSNIAEQGGGFYYLGNGFPCLISINNVIFQNNKATRLIGGAIALDVNDVYMTSKLNIYNMTAINNSGSIGGAIFLKYAYLSSVASVIKTFIISINASNFISNSVYFTSSKKYDFAFDTSLLISGLPSKFTGIGGALYLMCQGLCITSITNNTFDSNYAELAGGGIYASEVFLDTNIFINNSAILGGAIYTERFNYFLDPNATHLISSTKFQKNIAINPKDTENFDDILQSLSSYQYGGGGAIYTVFSQSNQMPMPLFIDNCDFIQNIASQVGGAIQGTLLNITNTIFKNNSANKGGALFGSDYQILDCEFISNQAINIFENAKSYPGKGGAIFLQQDLILNRSYINASIFHGNIAEASGGAIYITFNPPLINITTVKFEQNYASIYGPNLAAFPVSLTIWDSKQIENINYDIDFEFEFESIATQSNNLTLNIESGFLSKPLSIALLDIYGQIVSEDDSSQLILEPINENVIAQLVITPYFVTASKGIYTYPIGSQIIYKPGLNLDVFLISNAIVISPWKESKLVANIAFRMCVPGEIYKETTCFKCLGGYYSLEIDPYYQGLCQICDQNAMCFGGNLLTPKPGYWRKNSTADLIIPCPNADTCLGSSDNEEYASISGNCSEGYEGNLCSVCSKGFTMLGDTHQCYNCDAAWHYYVTVALVFLIKIIIFSYSIYSSIKSTSSEMGINQRKLEIRKIVLIKILINYAQLLTFAENFGIDMPSFAIGAVSGPSKISFNFSHIFSIDCYLDKQFSKYNINRFYLKALVAIALPMILILICTIIVFMPFEHMNNIPYIRKCSIWFINKRDYLFTGLLAFLVYFHQEILRTAFTFFECQNMYSINNPEYYLVNMPEILCLSDDHIRWSLAVALPTIFLWGIILPILLMWLVTQKKQPKMAQKTIKNHSLTQNDVDSKNLKGERIDSIKNDENLATKHKIKIINLEDNSDKTKHKSILQSQENKFNENPFVNDKHHDSYALKYSFLTKGYKKVNPSRLWEAYYMLRKLIMVLAIIFIPLISKLLSILLCIIIITLALLLQFTYSPFENDIPNTLESLSMISILNVYFVGIYFQGQGSKTFDIIMLGILFLSISIFLMKWIIEYMRVTSVSMNNKFGKFLIKILGNPEVLSKHDDIESQIIIDSNHNRRKRNDYVHSENFAYNMKLLIPKKLPKQGNLNNDSNKTFSHSAGNTLNTEIFAPKSLLIQQLKQMNNAISPEEQPFVLHKMYVNDKDIVHLGGLNTENNLFNDKFHLLTVQKDHINSELALDLEYENDDQKNQNDLDEFISEDLRKSDDYHVSEDSRKIVNTLPVFISQNIKKLT